MNLRDFFTLGVIIPPLPNTISNGQAIDAIPLMQDLNAIVAAVNANAAAAGDVATLQSQMAGVLAGGTPTLWTPVLSFGGSSAGITYAASGQQGVAWKSTALPLVFYFFRIKLTNKGAAAGVANIAGLPYTISTLSSILTTSGTIGSAALDNITIAANNYPVLTPLTTTTTFDIGIWPSGAFLSNVEFANTSGVQGMGFYPV